MYHPNLETVAGVVEFHAERSPEATAIVCSGRSRTYAELHRQSNRESHTPSPRPGSARVPGSPTSARNPSTTTRSCSLPPRARPCWCRSTGGSPPPRSTTSCATPAPNSCSSNPHWPTSRQKSGRTLPRLATIVSLDELPTWQATQPQHHPRPQHRPERPDRRSSTPVAQPACPKASYCATELLRHPRRPGGRRARLDRLATGRSQPDRHPRLPRRRHLVGHAGFQRGHHQRRHAPFRQRGRGTADPGTADHHGLRGAVHAAPAARRTRRRP